jgi:hypothetical protein
MQDRIELQLDVGKICGLFGGTAQTDLARGQRRRF